jgi:hypothetical protein
MPETKTEKTELHRQLDFYSKTTKEDLFIILRSFCLLHSDESEKWIDIAIQEKEVLKQNGII